MGILQDALRIIVGGQTSRAFGVPVGSPSSVGIFGTSGSKLAKRQAREILEAYETVPRLYAVIDRLASSVSAVPWRVYQVQGREGERPDAARGRVLRDLEIPSMASRPLLRAKAITKALERKDLEEVDGHPVLDLLDYGNADFDGQVVLHMISALLDLTGEAYIVIERGERFGLPRELWPLPMTAVTRRPTPRSRTYNFRVEGYEWRDIPEEDVIRIRRPRPGSPYGPGLGFAQVLANELDIDENAATATAQRFSNGLSSDMIITLKGAKEAQIRRFEAELQGKARGVLKSGVPFVTDAENIDVKEIAASMADAKMIELRNQQAAIIRETPGIPPEILGHVDNSNRATIDAADYLYNALSIDPRLAFLEKVLNKRLMSEFEAVNGRRNALLLYDSVIPEDREFRLSVMSANPGAFTKNEWRRTANFDEVEGGGEIMNVPAGSGIQIRTAILDIIANVAAKVISRQSGVQALVKFYGFDETTAESMLGPKDFVPSAVPDGGGGPTAAPTAPVPGPDGGDPPEGDPPEGDPGDEDAVAAAQLEARRIRLLRSPAEIENVVAKVADDEVADLVSDSGFLGGAKSWIDKCAPLMGAGSDVEVRELQWRSNVELSAGTIRRGLREALSRTDPDSWDDAISEVFEAARKRADLTAGNIVLGWVAAYSRDVGDTVADQWKEWVSQRDDLVRDHHTILDGNLIPIEDEFISPETGAAGWGPRLFGPPVDDINCRCFMIFATDDEVVKEGGEVISARSDEERARIWSEVDDRTRRFEAAFVEEWQGILQELESRCLEALAGSDRGAPFLELVE